MSQEWIRNVPKLDGAIPPPPVYIRPSTESPLPFAEGKLRDSTTAAELTPSDALIVLHLVLQERSNSTLNRPSQHVIRFSKRDEAPQSVCRVNIPGLGNHDKVEEYGHSKLEALVHACLSACQLLQMNGLLEPEHFPTIHPFVPVSRAIESQQGNKAKSNGAHTHSRRTPLFWTLSTEALGGLWFPTIVFIGEPAEGFGPLAILTRHPLPAIPDFRLFFSGNPVNVRMRKCQPGRFSSDELEQLRRATLRILRFISNKPLVGGLNQLPYLLFPLKDDVTLPNFLRDSHSTHMEYLRLGNPCESEVVTRMAASAFLPITVDNTEQITGDHHDAVIQDRKIEYTKHYFVSRVREDLTPLHKPREGEVWVPVS